MSSVPSRPRPTVILCRSFPNVEDARRAADMRTEGVSIALTTGLSLSHGQGAIVVFRIAGRTARQAVGKVELAGPAMSVRFEGMQASAVRQALSSPEHAAGPRKHPRFKCWLPATVIPAGHGAIVLGMACDLSIGGVRVMQLSGKLGAGDAVQVSFGAMRQTLEARVMWYLGSGVAGLSFSDDRLTALHMQRLVDQAAAREDDWVRTVE